MLTPQEVSEHAFAKASFGGYNMAMVDEFLDLLTADYTTLYNENAVLKSKMKVLADKVEEYRSTEEAMRKALLTAQRMADDMVQEAEAKKTSLLKDAEIEAAQRKAELLREIENEEFRLNAAKKDTSDYVAKIRSFYQHGLSQLDSLGDLVAPPKVTDTAASIPKAAMEIDETIQKLIAEEMAAAGSAPAPAEKEPEEEAPVQAQAAPQEEDDDDEPTEPTRRIDFDNLQFGKDFEIL